MRPIDADALKEQHDDLGWLGFYIKKVIDSAPTLDVEPVRMGEWGKDEFDVYWGSALIKRFCTSCGERPVFDKEKREFILTNYCPNCGARMEGERERSDD